MARERDLPAIAGGAPVRDRPLPFFRAAVDEQDIDAVATAMRSGWLTSGPRAIELEQRLGEYLGAAHTIVVSSCSEAMMLCLNALGIGPGDEVITSPITFASTVHAIIHNGATPVLADIENDTFGIDPEDVKRLSALADFFGLLPSGGSDWHGSAEGPRTIGCMHIPPSWLHQQDVLVARRASVGVA